MELGISFVVPVLAKHSKLLPASRIQDRNYTVASIAHFLPQIDLAETVTRALLDRCFARHLMAVLVLQD